jgi:thiol-disulfide isomerase/thioredoxin
MAERPSTMLALGTKAPYFELYNTHDYGARTISTDQLAGDKGLMLAFICNHCPYVIEIAEALGKFSRDYCNSGIGLAVINSNDAETYPADSADNMSRFATANEFAMPYLYDKNQTVARACCAACTPDFYLFDKDIKLVYRGQFDGVRPGSRASSNGEDLRKACNAVIEGREVDKHQIASLGCSIKWAPGKEPTIFN